MCHDQEKNFLILKLLVVNTFIITYHFLYFKTPMFTLFHSLIVHLCTFQLTRIPLFLGQLPPFLIICQNFLKFLLLANLHDSEFLWKYRIKLKTTFTLIPEGQKKKKKSEKHIQNVLILQILVRLARSYATCPNI